MKKICFVTASPLTLRVFMRNHILSLSEKYNVTAVADLSSEDLLDNWLPGVRLVPIPIARQINLLADLRELVALLLFFRKERFDVVHSVTPKAGLLTMIAARLAGIPIRIHCFTGQLWVTRQGFGRLLLKSIDCLMAANATHILADSLSQCEFLEKERIVRQGLIKVLAKGSISGVDLDRFRPDEVVRLRIRQEWGVPPNACLLLFVGRLNRDKGVLDLAQAFADISFQRDDIWLVLVGPDEAGISKEFERLCGDTFSRVIRVNFTPTPEHAMAAADVFVMPSYREGFGSAVIEAAACGIPTVASRIYGLTDAVEENVTGLMHSPGDVAALSDCLRRFCNDRELRLKMGNVARVRVEENFSMSMVTKALVTYYEKLLVNRIGGKD